MKKVFLVFFIMVMASSLLASNMGFKLSRQLIASATVGQAINSISLPFFVSYTSVSDVWTDLIAEGVPVAEIYRIHPTDKVACSYFGDPDFDCVFPISKGEGFFVVLSGSTNDAWVIVGSHDPAFEVPLIASATVGQAINAVAVPYHTTLADTTNLWTELVTQGVPVAEIYSVDPIAKTACSYFGDPDFDCITPLTPGFSVQVVLSGSTSDTWMPSHY